MASPGDPNPSREKTAACAPAPPDQPPGVFGGAEVTFNVGDEFGSFSALEDKIALYSAKNYVQLWKRDARTIEGAKKRVGKIAASMSDTLKYQSVRYCCIQGGKKFTSKATGRQCS